jgi:hypothetical protein
MEKPEILCLNTGKIYMCIESEAHTLNSIPDVPIATPKETDSGKFFA